MHIPTYETEKLGARSMVVAHDTRISTNCLLNFRHLTIERPGEFDHCKGGGPAAANSTDDRTYRSRALTLGLGLNRTFRWVFVVVDVPCPIIATKFLQYFDLLVDGRRRKAVDCQALLIVTAS